MLTMPDIDKNVMGRREQIAEALRKIVPGEGVITEEAERRAYETDGLTAYKQLPLIVVLPETTERAGLGPRSLAAHCRWRTVCCLDWVNSIKSLRSTMPIGVQLCSQGLRTLV